MIFGLWGVVLVIGCECGDSMIAFLIVFLVSIKGRSIIPESDHNSGILVIPNTTAYHCTKMKNKVCLILVVIFI